MMKCLIPMMPMMMCANDDADDDDEGSEGVCLGRLAPKQGPPIL